MHAFGQVAEHANSLFSRAPRRSPAPDFDETSLFWVAARFEFDGKDFIVLSDDAVILLVCCDH